MLILRPDMFTDVMLAACAYLDTCPVLHLPREELLDGLYGHFVRNVEYSHPFGEGRVGKRPYGGIHVTEEVLRIFLSRLYRLFCPTMGAVPLGSSFFDMLAHVPALKQLEKKER